MAVVRVGNVLRRLIRRIATCREVTKLIAREQEGAPALSEWIRLEVHLVGCRGRSCYRRQLRLTGKTLAHLPIPEVARSTRRCLLQEFQARRDRRPQSLCERDAG
jgi:hypothetical protein